MLLGRLPGGLLHANIASCAVFSAVSGSSVATAATIGVVAMGEIEKHRYNERLFLGVALLLLARALLACAKKDLDGVFRLIGSKSAAAEASEEIVAVERALEAERKE